MVKSRLLVPPETARLKSAENLHAKGINSALRYCRHSRSPPGFRALFFSRGGGVKRTKEDTIRKAWNSPWVLDTDETP